MKYTVYVKIDSGSDSYSLPIAFFYSKHAAHNYTHYMEDSSIDDLYVTYYVKEVNVDEKI